MIICEKHFPKIFEELKKNNLDCYIPKDLNDLKIRLIKISKGEFSFDDSFLETILLIGIIFHSILLISIIFHSICLKKNIYLPLDFCIICQSEISADEVIEALVAEIKKKYLVNSN